MNSNKFKIYVIHHSHTDIGYTDRQEKITLYHVDFIKQALDILKEKYNHSNPTAEIFKWTCESFWCVEQFLSHADEEYRHLFCKAVQMGDICISGSYLNLTELVEYDILTKKIADASDFGKRCGVAVDSAMTADINGYSWGFSQALSNNGIKNLLSSVHTHHGMFPLERKQTPFWWKTPNGESIFVWNGEHYHLGNELGIAEGYEVSYLIHDSYSKNEPEYKLNKDKNYWRKRSEKRIFNYVNQLKKENYQYDFAPVMVSGMSTDNAPPNISICDFVNRWNRLNGEKIELKIINIDGFFREIKPLVGKINTYKGDWTDWWADGIGSTPAAVKSYKDAQRKYHICKLIDPEIKSGNIELIKKTEENLMLYSEHTWGYSSSITEPCNTLVNELDMRKTSLAIKANEAVSENLDMILYNRGDSQLYPNKNFKYRIINPHNESVKDYGKIIIFDCQNIDDNFVVVNLKTEEIYPHQIERVSRGRQVSFLVELDAKKKITVELKCITAEEDKRSVQNYAYIGSEGVRDLDVSVNNQDIANSFLTDNRFFRIKYNTKKGIYSWYDKINKRELIEQGSVNTPFTPIYQVTPIITDHFNERKIMGRNRKGFHAETYNGKVKAVNVISSDSLLSKIDIVYELKGTSYSSLLLTVYNQIPRVDVTYRVIKDNTIQPENMYLNLNFNLPSTHELWIEKSGAAIRPGIDQIPGTCIDYYLLQNGMAYVGEKNSLLISVKDAPLIFMGDINYHPIKLAGDKIEDNKRPIYSWIMNNFWETNFKAVLGGAYEFTYSIEMSDVTDVGQLMKNAFRTCSGLTVFPVKE